MKETIPY